MFVEFSVENYRSFKERVTLSMVAANNIRSRSEALDEHDEHKVFSAGPGLELLTSAAVYGANASGKSNLIRGLDFMRMFVLNSSRETQITEAIPVEPFLLSTATEDQPSLFEIVFLTDDTQYRYGFAVHRQGVVSEWLYRLGKSREMRLFERDRDAIKVNARNFPEGQELEKRTRPNALFLSVVAQFNGRIATRILRWFNRLIVNTGIDDRALSLFFAVTSFEQSSYREDIEQFIRRLDVGIERFLTERRPALFAIPKNMPKELAAFVETLNQRIKGPEQIRIRTFHRRFNAADQPQDEVLFDLEEQESEGTQRLFVLAYPFLRTLRQGSVLVIDEMDARLHPNLVTELIRLFHSVKTNPNQAQLVFTTHNTNLLSAQLFRRDQVWFVEKSRRGASDLYSLVEYRTDNQKIVRNDAPFEKDYVMGRYGAIPFIGNLDELLGVGVGQESQGSIEGA
ncbi:MAG: ATP-binding protein [Chloroflexaceae bacterium]|nr:ATP-binding protein [Chloroflexaceae bacterium]